MNEILVALDVLLKGMTGIFIALSIIYGAVVLLVKVFPSKPEHKEEDNN